VAKESGDGHAGELYPGLVCSGALEERSRLSDATTCEGESIFHSEALADQEFIIHYTDTLANYPDWQTGQHFDVDDGDHRPLGISVTQHSFQWMTEPDIGQILLLRYDIESISDDVLRSPYAGLFVDADICLRDDTNDNLWNDDLILSRSILEEDGTRLSAMVFLDNDGRGQGGIIYPHAMAILAKGQQGATHSINWYMHWYEGISYGPFWRYYREHPELGLAWQDTTRVPLADRHKYSLMGNGEIDPPFYGVVGTIPPQPIYNEQGQVIAERSWISAFENFPVTGQDVRGLISIGPLGTPDGVDSLGRPQTVLAPGETLQAWFAIVMGDDIHDAAHPQETPLEEIDPDLFDFSSLDQRLRLAATELAQLPVDVPEAPSLASEVVIPGQLRLHWTPATNAPPASYRLQRVNLRNGQTVLLADSIQVLEYVASYAAGDSLRYRLTTTWGGQWAARELDFTAPRLFLVPGDGCVDISCYCSTPVVRIVYGRMPEQPSGEGYCWPPDCLLDTDTLRVLNNRVTHISDLENLQRYMFRVHSESNGNVLTPQFDWVSAIPAGHDQGWLVAHVSHGLGDSDTSVTRQKFVELFASAGLDFTWRTTGIDNDPLDRSILQNHAALWIDVDWRDDGSAVFQTFRPVDLLHFLETGGRLVLSSNSPVNTTMGLPRDPADAEDIIVVQIPMPNPSNGQGGMLAPPWSAQVEDPLWGNLHVTSSEEPFFLSIPVLEQWSHAGVLAGSGNDQFDGLLASAAYLEPYRVDLLLFPLKFVDLDASREFLTALLEASTTDLPKAKDVDTGRPWTMTLHPCAPNPFNPSTQVSFSLPQAGPIRLSLFNLKGQHVLELLDQPLAAGEHTVLLNGTRMASGVYLVRLETPVGCATQKVLLVK